MRNIRQRAQHIAQEENHQIKLVAISALAAGLLPAALSRLPEHLRPQQIQLQSMSPENVVQAVLSKTMDLGAVSLPLEHRGLKSTGSARRLVWRYCPPIRRWPLMRCCRWSCCVSKH